MKVILLKELKGKGGEGDVIDVARGFANNYLLTQGYAIRATKGNLKQLEQRRNNIAKREETRIANANELAEKLEGLRVCVPVQVGEEGQLFGSVTSIAIADAINDSLGIEIDKHRVELSKPIKAVGEYPVDVSIYRNIKATVNVAVVDEKAEQETDEADDSKDAATDKKDNSGKADKADNKAENKKTAETNNADAAEADKTAETDDVAEADKTDSGADANTDAKPSDVAEQNDASEKSAEEPQSTTDEPEAETGEAVDEESNSDKAEDIKSQVEDTESQVEESEATD